MKKKALELLFLLTAISLFAEKIQFSADSMTGSVSDKNDSTVLFGNAFVKTETMEIKADKIELNGDNFRYIYATGSVDGKNEESKMDFTCGKMTYDRETKIATLENKVHLIDIENEVTADAQIIEYNQNTEIAIMQIGVKLLQKDNVCTGAYAVYKKGEQTLSLTGNPKITQGEDVFRAHEISLNLDTQEITLDSRVSGTVSDKKEDKKEETPKDDKKTEDEAASDDSEASKEEGETSTAENEKTDSPESGETKDEASSQESEKNENQPSAE